MVKRKAETLTQSSPDALEPSTVAQQRKTTCAAPPATLPKMLTYPNKVVPSAIACIAVARCGSDEGQMAAMMMERPVMAATLVFDSIREQDCVDAEQNLGVLLQHFSSVFETLGGSAAAVFDEWSRLHRMVVRDASLCALPLEELYSRALLHFQHNHFNLLLLMALVQASAMDVVLAECGAPRLLSALKQESARCRGKMLLFLVEPRWLAMLG